MDRKGQIEVRGRRRGRVRERVLAVCRVVLVEPSAVFGQALVIREDEYLRRLGGACLTVLERVEQVRPLGEEPGVRLRAKVPRRVESFKVSGARRAGQLRRGRRAPDRPRWPAPRRKGREAQRLIPE